MSENTRVPTTLVRAMGEDIEVDVPQRILKRAHFVTRGIASDGGIIVPEGINTTYFEQNPVVMLSHGWADAPFPVVGRSLGLTAADNGMDSVTQFADDPDGLGRQLAYLYGVNEDKAVYARGWSFSWDTQEFETWTLDHAKEYLGKDYDDNLVPPHVKRWDEVWVVLRCVMNEYSCVPLGADKMALSRAHKDKGIDLAGRWVANLDITEARAELTKLQQNIRNHETIFAIRKLTAKLQALSRDGAAAAERGDSAEVLHAVRDLVRLAKEKN